MSLNRLYPQDNTNHDILICAWEDTALKPKSINIPHNNSIYSKALKAMNRKQFLDRRRQN